MMAKRAELDLDRPEQFLVRERRYQRIGAVAMILFVCVGLLGLFGDGPLSDATERQGPIEVRYQRFARESFRSALSIRIATRARSGESVPVNISRSFLDHLAVLETRPPDAQKHAETDTVRFEATAANGTAHLELRYEPEGFGLRRITIAAEGHTVEVWQLVYF